MNKLLIYILLLFSTLLSAQDYQKDTLYQRYKQSEGKQKIKCILDLVEEGNTPQTIIKQLTKEAVKISLQSDYETKQLALYIQGKYYLNKYMQDSAYYFLKRFVTDSNNKKMTTLFIKSAFSLSKIVSRTKKEEDNTKWLNLLKKIAKGENNKEAEAYYYLANGTILGLQGSSRENIGYYKKAIKIFKELNNFEKLGFCYIQMADSYSNMQQQKDAIKYISLVSEIESHLSIKLKSAMYYLMARLFYLNDAQPQNEKDLLFQSLKYAKYLENDYLINRIYTGLLIYHARNQNFDSAAYYNLKSINEFRATNDITALLTGYKNAILIYSDRNELSVALQYADTAIALARSSKKERQIYTIFLSLGKIYLGKGKYDIAKSYIDSINDVMKIILPLDKIKVYSFFYKYYKETKKYKKALEYRDIGAKLNDSLLRTRYKSTIDEVYIRMQTKEKEQEITNLKAEKEKEEFLKKKIINSWIATIVLLLILSIVLILYRKNVKQRRVLTKVEKDKLEQEKQILTQENKLLESQQEIVNQKLQAHKNMLTSTNNFLLQQSQLSGVLIDAIKSLKPYSNKEGKDKINTYLADLSGYSKEKNWQTFEQNFVLLYPNFSKNLISQYPELTTSEEKISALIKMDLSTKEISEILGFHRLSIYRHKKSIREKLSLEDNQNLEGFIKDFE